MADFNEAEKKQFQKLNERIEKENKEEFRLFEEESAQYGWDSKKEIDRILLQVLFLCKKHIPGSDEQTGKILKNGPSPETGYLQSINETDVMMDTDELNPVVTDALESLFALRNFCVKNHQSLLPVIKPEREVVLLGNGEMEWKNLNFEGDYKEAEEKWESTVNKARPYLEEATRRAKSDESRIDLLRKRNEILEARRANAVNHEDAAKAGDGKVFVLSDYIDLKNPEIRTKISDAAKRCNFPNPESEETAKNLFLVFLLSQSVINERSIFAPWETMQLNNLQDLQKDFLRKIETFRMDADNLQDNEDFLNTIREMAKWSDGTVRLIKKLDQPFAGELAKAYLFVTERFNDRTVKHTDKNIAGVDIGEVFLKNYHGSILQDKVYLKNLAEGKETDAFRMPETEFEDVLRVLENNEKYDLYSGMAIAKATEANPDINDRRIHQGMAFAEEAFDRYFDALEQADREWVNAYQYGMSFVEKRAVPAFLSRFTIDGKKAEELLKEQLEDYDLQPSYDRRRLEKVLIVNAMMNGKKVEYIPFVRTNNPQKPVGLATHGITIKNIPKKLPAYMDSFNVGDFLNLNDPDTRQALLAAGFQEENLTGKNIGSVLLMYLTGNDELGEEKITVKELPKLKDWSAEKKAALGRKFIEDIKAHPVVNQTGNQKDENLKWYGRIVKNAMNSLKNCDISIPYYQDLNTPAKVYQVNNSPFVAAAYVAQGLVESLPNAWEDNAFLTEYGIADYMDDKILFMGPAKLGNKVPWLAAEGIGVEQIHGDRFQRWDEKATFKNLKDYTNWNTALLQRAAFFEESEPEYKPIRGESPEEKEKRLGPSIKEMHDGGVRTIISEINEVEPKELYQLSFIPNIPNGDAFNPGAVSKEELKKSGEIFDIIFARLIAEESWFMQKTGEDVTEGFQATVDKKTISVKEEVERILTENKIQNLTKEEIVSYRKAYILRQMANPDVELSYREYVYNPDRTDEVKRNSNAHTVDYVKSDEVIAQEEKAEEEMRAAEEAKQAGINAQISELNAFVETVNPDLIVNENLQIANPEVFLYVGAENLSDEELAKTEKVFDTIFAPVADKEWFHLGAFRAYNPFITENAQKAALASDNGDKKAIQIGKAEILRALLHPSRKLSIIIADKECPVEPKITEALKKKETEFKAKINKKLQDAMTEVMDSEELAFYEIKISATEEGPDGPFEFTKTGLQDSFELVKAGQYFDKIFGEVASSLPKRSDLNSLYRKFTINGQNIYEYIHQGLQVAKVKGNNDILITKAFILHNLAKHEQLGFTAEVFDTEKEGYSLKVPENYLVQTKHSRQEILEQRRQEEEAKQEEIRRQEEQKRLEREAKEAEERRIAAEKERQINAENEARQNQLDAQAEIRNAESLKAIEDYEADFKNEKYTHRNLAMPEQTPETLMDTFRGEDFMDLSTDEKRMEANGILKNAGIDNPENPKVVSALLVLYLVGEKNKSIDEISAMSEQDKKAAGAEFLQAFKDRPVVGNLAGSEEKTKENLAWYGKMVGNANAVWLHKSGITFPAYDELREPEKFTGLMKGKFGLAYDLSVMMPKLLKNWNSRSNKPTAENPYGIDRGHAFIQQYSNKKPLDNKNQLHKDQNCFLSIAAVGNAFTAFHHNDPANPVQNKLKALKLIGAQDKFPFGKPLDHVNISYDLGYEMYENTSADYPDEVMDIIDNADDKDAEEIVKNGYSSSTVPENFKEQWKPFRRAGARFHNKVHLHAGTAMARETMEGIAQINESSHPEILDLPFNSEENLDKEPDIANLIKEENRNELDRYEAVFEQVFDPIKYMETNLGNEKYNYTGNVYKDFAMKFTINGVKVKDTAEKLTGINDNADFGDLKLRNKVAKVLILHAMATGKDKIEFAPSTMSYTHYAFDLKPVEIKPFTHAMKRETEETKEILLHPEKAAEIEERRRQNAINEQNKNVIDINAKDDGNDFDEARIDGIGNEEENNIIPGNKNNNMQNEGMGEKDNDSESNSDYDNEENRTDLDLDEFDVRVKKRLEKPDKSEKQEKPGMRIGHLYDMEADEKALVALGGLEGWKKAVVEDFKAYIKLLVKTQKNEKANIKSGAGDEGPVDYTDIIDAMKECAGVIKDENSTLNDIRRTFDNFRLRTYRYRGNHREFIRSHRSEETAERYRIISSMADLADLHLKLYDEYKNELEQNLISIKMNFGKSLGTKKISAIKKAINYDDWDLTHNSPAEHFLDGGEKGYRAYKNEKEKEILYARYGRRTNLKNAGERLTLGRLYGKNQSQMQLAGNFLDNHFMKAIDKTKNVTQFIAVNEPMRDKVYQKGVRNLGENWYFTRYLKLSEKKYGWEKNWTEIERKSGELYKQYKEEVKYLKTQAGNAELTGKVANALQPLINIDDYIEDEPNPDRALKNNPEENAKNAHKVLAEALLKRAMTQTKFAALLNAYADSTKRVREALTSDVASYLQRVEPLGNNTKNLGKRVMNYMDNSELVEGVANRARSFYRDWLFVKQDEYNANMQEEKSVNSSFDNAKLDITVSEDTKSVKSGNEDLFNLEIKEPKTGGTMKPNGEGKKNDEVKQGGEKNGEGKKNDEGKKNGEGKKNDEVKKGGTGFSPRK